MKKSIEVSPHCPKCQYEYTYVDHDLFVCPDCQHQWSINEANKEEKEAVVELIVLDAYGNKLADGDSVSLIKDLKVKGSSSGLKIGTQVKKIQLFEGGDGHNISCRIDGIGAINLKSEFVKKI